MMANKLNIFTASYTPDPVTGTVHEKAEHLFDTKKVFHSKDDEKELNEFLAAHNIDWGKSRVTGKQRTSVPTGFKTSATCDKGYARGHNIRDPNFVNKKEHVDKEGLHKTYIDLGDIGQCYKDIFGEALEEYNKKQFRKDRRIENYLTHILGDKRRGTMKRNANVDNSRKACYEFIFEIGNRDNQIDRNLAIEILEKFCLEWMPEHYPNLKPIGVTLHADEFTVNPITHKRIDSAPHIHFGFIPIAHSLTDEEIEDFKKWKQELKEKEIAECKKNGKKFSEEAFRKRDWEFERAKRYGKAEMESLSIQASLSGACAEMGFRTRGTDTAQQQMQRAVHEDFYDMLESYGIPVNRVAEKDREKKVRIDVYKAREDNKVILKEIKESLKEVKKETARNKSKEQELERRENRVEGLEKRQKDVEKRETEVQKREDKVAPYVERIDTLVEDEKAVRFRENAADKKETELVRRNTDLNEKEKVLNQRKENLDDFRKSLDERKTGLDAREDELSGREETVSVRENAVKALEAQNKADADTNKENAEKVERNLKELNRKLESFRPMEEQYKKYVSTVNVNKEIRINVRAIGSELKTELSEPGGTWWEKVDLAVGNFTERCHKIAVKFQDAVRGFRNFLQGKTSRDFRKMADDMDRNGAQTFEEYEKKWNCEELDWQVEERKKKMELKPVKKSYEIERD